ncbi:protein wingless-like isoform X1 [Sycon ciliatum]|uniref:protein wingless-like isoform X1 n=2 Tax=Sycon ciliatum TaxID=27933 RepID=UPI0031F6C060
MALKLAPNMAFVSYRTISSKFVTVICLLMAITTIQALPGRRRPHNNVNMTFMDICSKMDTVTAQVRCFARRGAVLAVNTCQDAFFQEKWNCPESSLVPMLKDTTNMPQAAFMKALTSAMVAYEIAQGCYYGYTKLNCYCPVVAGKSEKGVNNAFECAQVMGSGVSGAKLYLDTDHIAELLHPFNKIYPSGGAIHSTQEQVRFHNNRKGREVFKRMARVKCTCHGLSGACNLKTCVRTPARPAAIARELRRMYDNARFMQPQQARNLRHVRPAPTQLLYTAHPPSMCQPLPDLGFPGIQNRQCTMPFSNPVAFTLLPKPGACSALCCGRNILSKDVSVVYKSVCDFKWDTGRKCVKSRMTSAFYYCV